METEKDIMDKVLKIVLFAFAHSFNQISNPNLSPTAYLGKIFLEKGTIDLEKPNEDLLSQAIQSDYFWKQLFNAYKRKHRVRYILQICDHLRKLMFKNIFNNARKQAKIDYSKNYTN